MKSALATGLAAFCVFTGIPAFPSDTGSGDVQALKKKTLSEFSGRTSKEWGEAVTGVRRRLATDEMVIALTLDACGSPKGKGFDAALIEYLETEKIPATLFMNARWIDANRELFLRLAANPLFEIANHGTRHKPASVNGSRVYGINGTGSVADLVDEIEMNSTEIEKLTGKRPRYYRSGTAFYDEVAVAAANSLGYEVVGFTVLGDAGATYTGGRVRDALLGASPGAIVILHMNHPEGQTAAGVRAAIPELRKRGFAFVKLSDYELK